MLQKEKKYDVAILGPGAIGQLLAHQLLAQSFSVCFLYKKKLSIDTPFVCTDNNKNIKNYIETFALTENIGKDIKQLIVATKTYQTYEALQTVLQWLPTSCPIIFIQNGLGIQLDIIKKWSQHYYWIASTSQGVYKKSMHHIIFNGTGEQFISPLNHNSIDCPIVFSRLHYQYMPNYQTMVWQKLTINTIINTLTLRDNIKNGQLLDLKYENEIYIIATELEAIATALNIKDSIAKILKRTYTVIERTQNNISSTLCDFNQGKATEIEDIIGFMIKKIQEHQLKCEKIYKLYKQITTSSFDLMINKGYN